MILNIAIRGFLRRHAQHSGALSAADIEDIASEKSLDLLRKIESRAWDIGDRTDDEIAGFLSHVARNGVVDHSRRHHRHRQIEVELERDQNAVKIGRSPGIESPEVKMEQRRFVEALTECAKQLEPEPRRIWFLSVFYGLSVQEIAVRPDVAARSSGVGMLLSRLRQKIGKCMERKGHRVTDLPPGTFVEIWNLLHGEEEGERSRVP